MTDIYLLLARSAKKSSIKKNNPKTSRCDPSTVIAAAANWICNTLDWRFGKEVFQWRGLYLLNWKIAFVLKKNTTKHYPFLVQYILVSAVTYTALLKGQLSVRIETLSVPKALAFLSCFFGPAMPYLFQTVLPPSTVTTTFPESQHISDTASGKGYSWLWLATQSSLADGPMSGVSCSESWATPRGSNRCGSGRPLFHFPVHGSGNCSESTYLIGVRPADKTARYQLPC